MEHTYNFCWIRVKPRVEFDITKYTDKDIPVPLPLEGSGLQYVFAFDKEEATEIVEKLNHDGHDANRKPVNGQDQYDYTFTTQDPPHNYCVAMSYNPYSYFLVKK